MILIYSRASSCIRMDFSNSVMDYRAFPHLLMHCHADLCIPCILMFFHTFTHPHSFMHPHAHVLSLFVRIGVCKTLKKQHFENSAPTNKAFARNAHADSRGNMRVGVTVVQSWSESVFPLSLECPLDWREFLGVGVTAAPHPVSQEVGGAEGISPN